MPSELSLLEQVTALTQRLERLSDYEEIRTCLFRINRGVDRIDVKLLASGFFPDARIRWGTPEAASFDEWLNAAITMLHKTQRAQHLIGNILIEITGDKANVEAVEIGRHLTPVGNDMKDLVLASRYVDKFERRDGLWRIVHRDKVCDWARILEGTDPIWDNIPLKGTRDASDISFEVFGKHAFHSLL